MEKVFDASVDNQITSDLENRESDLGDWLDGCGYRLGRLLKTELELVVTHLYMQTPDDCLSILEHHASAHPETFVRLWTSPLTQSFVRILESGDQQQRSRLRRLEERRLTDSRGRPTKDPEETRDVEIARAVRTAERRLATAFQMWKTCYVRGSLEERRARVSAILREKGYHQQEVDAILGNRNDDSGEVIRPARHLLGAACRLIALQRGQTVDRIRLAHRRSKRFL
jgi:hypothetical protein